MLYYAKRGFVVVPVRQDPGLSSRPDLVVIPVDKSTWRPIYSKSIAVEVESCNEVETHPEQVARNWIKESVRDFAEIHTWTWDKCYGRLREIYEKASVDKSRVKIFSVKIPVEKLAKEASIKPAEASPATLSEKSALPPSAAAIQPTPVAQTQLEATCNSERVAFTLSSGRVVCVPVNLVVVLKMFMDKGYRVEATRTRIVVYDERDEEVFSSSL